MNFIDTVIQKINEACNEYNFKIQDSRSLVRCIDLDTGKMLIAYSKQAKTVKIYIDAMNNLNDDEEVSTIVTTIFRKVEHVQTSRNDYYSHQGTIDNFVRLDNLLLLLKYLNENKEKLRSLTQSTSTNTRRMAAACTTEFIYNRSLKFGLEIECYVPSLQRLTSELEQKGITVSSPSTTHQVVQGWKLVYDSSIRAPRGYVGVEVVAPPSTNFDELKIVIETLKEVGAKTNKSCGIHVHHEIADLKRQQIIRLYNFYNKYHKAIDMMMDKSRLNNHYCKPIDASKLMQVNECTTKTQLLKTVAGEGNGSYYASCRYYVLNLRSFLFYGTIEFRQLDSKIDIDHITSWINFTHKIIERGMKLNSNIKHYESEVETEEMFEDMINELEIGRTTDTHKTLSKKFKKNLRKREQ